MVVEGQAIGGIAQGIGTALYEEMPYDENGQPLASTLADYMLPGATEVPNIRIEHMETPSPHTEFGAKGMGEGGAIAPPAVLFNAVNDALRAIGAAELLATPLTPRRLLAAIEQGRAGAADHAPPSGPALDNGMADARASVMKAARFDYARPMSLDAALPLLTESTKPMAGGQSLGPMLNLRLARPARVIDVGALTALRGVTVTPAGIEIGAGDHACRDRGRGPCAAARTPGAGGGRPDRVSSGA